MKVIGFMGVNDYYSNPLSQSNEEIDMGFLLAE
jgi:hypothetical protein